MKKGYTHLEFILDRSGSMQPVMNDLIGGTNKVIEDQVNLPGTCTFSVNTFDTIFERLFNLADPKDETKRLSTLNIFARGGTALYDAIGKTINELGNKLSLMKEDDRPEKVLVVIYTDGEENSSKEFTLTQIKEMTERQQKVYNWEFMYLGANQDGFMVGKAMGIDNAASYVSSSRGYEKTSGLLFNKIAALRSGNAMNCNLTESEKEDLVNV